MKRRKRNGLLGTLFVTTVCLVAGCAASPASHDPVDVECEAYEESAVVKLSETGEEAEVPLAAGLQKPENGKEAEEQSAPGLQESETVDEPEPPSEEEIAALGIREDMLAYWMVLNNKRAFVSWNEGGQKFYWNEWFWYLGEVETRYHAVGFMIVDMDGDGREEVVLDCSPEATQVLHYEEGEVYSYQFVFRGMMSIRENGFYIGSDGAADNQFYRLTKLNKDGYTEEMLAKMENGYYGDKYYEIGGKEVTEEEFWDYWESLESVERAEEMEFTESMLDRQLLGSLSEQELALVKRIPAENMLEKEPDYQEHKQALQLYAAVLSGEEEEIYVTVDACPWIDEPVEDYDISSHDWIRYYFYSEEIIAQWLK